MEHKQHLYEEKIIDYILGNIDEKEVKKISIHINQCEHCQRILNNWKFVLHKRPDEVRNPSKLLKLRVWNSIENLQNRSKQIKRLKPSILFTSIALIIIILFTTTNLFSEKTNEKYFATEQQNADFVEKNFQENQHTQQLPIIPVNNQNDLNGNVWVNVVTKEMLLQVKGLEPFTNQDHQLWIIYNDDTFDYEVLPIVNGETKIFIEGVNVEEFKLLKASLEPKGGSSNQIGPEIFFVDFKK